MSKKPNYPSFDFIEFLQEKFGCTLDKVPSILIRIASNRPFPSWMRNSYSDLSGYDAIALQSEHVLRVDTIKACALLEWIVNEGVASWAIKKDGLRYTFFFGSPTDHILAKMCFPV